MQASQSFNRYIECFTIGKVEQASSTCQPVTAKRCTALVPALAFNLETEPILRALDKRKVCVICPVKGRAAVRQERTCGADAPLTGHRDTDQRVVKSSKPYGVPGRDIF